MAQQYASGETMRLTLKLTPAAVTMTGNKDVGTTSGRFYLSNNNQKEWINFTGKTNNGDGTYTYTGLTRGLSQTADPVTGGTGSTWLANQECILVAMHDQLVDKTQATTFAETITFAKDINFTGTTTGGLTLKSLTQAQINALTPVVGYKVFNTDTGTVQTYYSGTWNNEGTSTTPNASTTVAGKVEIATQAEVNAGTQIGGTGAFLTVGPDTLANATNVPNINALTEKLTPASLDYLLLSDSAASFVNKKVTVQSITNIAQTLFFGDQSDGDVTISSNTTLTRDMHYRNLTINTGVELKTNGFKLFVYDTLTRNGTGKISVYGGNGGNGAASYYGPGGTAGTQANTAGTLPASPVSSNGRWFDNATGSTASSVTDSLLNLGGSGGGAGGGNPGGGAAGKSGGSLTSYIKNNLKTVFDFFTLLSVTGTVVTFPSSSSPGAGGGGYGANGGANDSGAGGGGGAAGGIFWGAIRRIVANNTNILFDLHGGNGGNGASAASYSSSSALSGGGGGGGGGNGGFGFLLYQTIDQTLSVIVNVLGGTGGSFGTGGVNSGSGASGQNGVAGTNGNNGTFYSIQAI